MNLQNVVLEHHFRSVKIGNHPVFQWPDDFNRGRIPSQHFFGFLTDGQHPLAFFVHGHHRRLPDDNPLAPDMHQGIGRPQINPHVI